MRYLERDLDQKVGKNIAKTRKELGYTQIKLSEELGISRRAFGSYETGEHAVPIFILLRLKELFDVSFEMLLGTEHHSDISLDRRTKQARIRKEMKRIEKLDPEEQQLLFSMVDRLSKKSS